jgi:hypothetical protein
MGKITGPSIPAVIAAGVAAILCALFAAMGILVNYDLNRHGKIASARVLETQSGRNSHVTVEFTTAAGQRVRTRVNDVDERPGTIIRVKYLPDDPQNGIKKAGSHSDAAWIGGLALTAALMALLTLGVATGRLVVRGGRIARVSPYGG